MASGKDNGQKLDPLTDWASAAIGILKKRYQEGVFEAKANHENMLLLVQTLDHGDTISIFGNLTFMKKSEELLLAILIGEAVKVVDLNIFNARMEIFATAQVIYNQGVARGLWKSHPEIRHAIKDNQ